MSDHGDHPHEYGRDHDTGHHDHEQGGSHDHGHSHDDGHDHHEHDHGHHHHEHDVETLSVAVVTVSSSRSLDDDPAGDAIASIVEGKGHEVSVRNLVSDTYDGVQSEVNTLTKRDDVDVVVTTGGTGVTPDDVTVEAIDRLFDKRLPGFGELFRRLSFDEIGTRVIATRATAGIIEGVPVFCLPGSENAARLGTEEIIVPESGHLAGLAQREQADEERDEVEREREKVRSDESDDET